MSRAFRLALAAALAVNLAGCAVLVSPDEVAGPVHGNPVNPTPVPGYRVGCATYPGYANALFADYYAACRRYIGPDGQVVVVQARARSR